MRLRRRFPSKFGALWTDCVWRVTMMKTTSVLARGFLSFYGPHFFGAHQPRLNFRLIYIHSILTPKTSTIATKNSSGPHIIHPFSIWLCIVSPSPQLHFLANKRRTFCWCSVDRPGSADCSLHCINVCNLLHFIHRFIPAYVLLFLFFGSAFLSNFHGQIGNWIEDQSDAGIEVKMERWGQWCSGGDDLLMGSEWQWMWWGSGEG